MTFLSKQHNFVTTDNVIQHILHSNSTKERLINYSISCSLRACTQFIPYGGQSAEALYYITFLKTTCIMMSQLALCWHSLICWQNQTLHVQG